MPAPKREGEVLCFRSLHKGLAFDFAQGLGLGPQRSAARGKARLPLRQK